MSALCCQYSICKEDRQGETLAAKVRRCRSGAGDATRRDDLTSASCGVVPRRRGSRLLVSPCLKPNSIRRGICRYTDSLPAAGLNNRNRRLAPNGTHFTL
jgi:hypothetical protein